LDGGKKLSKDIAGDTQLHRDYRFDESQAMAEKEAVDDEYAAQSGTQDPRIVVTTSRDPSSKLAQFCKEIRLLLPTSIRINRGNNVLPTLVAAAQSSMVTDLILLHEHRGVPTSLTISHLPHGPTASFSLHNVLLRHDIDDPGPVSEVYPQLIFEGFTTDLGRRVVSILKHLFPPGPKPSSSRIITFANQSDFISVRQHVYAKGPQGIQLAEIGPRFEMKLYEINLGTVDRPNADVEWRLKPFMRTSSKRDYL